MLLVIICISTYHDLPYVGRIFPHYLQWYSRYCEIKKANVTSENDDLWQVIYFVGINGLYYLLAKIQNSIFFNNSFLV